MPTVLIVDDDPGIRETLRLYCQLQGYRVRTVADGPAAVQACLHAPPDLLLLDLTLPGMPGLEVLRRLRPCRPEMAVIIVSGALQGTTQEEARRLGATACLAKPVSLQDLGRVMPRARAAG